MSEYPATSLQPTMRIDAAAEYVCLSTITLRRLHREGKGPRRTRAGGRIIVYLRNDLDAWLASRVEVSANAAIPVQ